MRASATDVQNSITAAFSCMEIRETCQRLTRLIDTCANQQLGAIFQRLMEDIFNSRAYKWSLAKCAVPAVDSLCTREFLGINGPMFRLIHRMQHHGIQAQGPNLGSVNFQMDLHDGFLILSAFEAYFSHFAQFIKKASPTTPNNLLLPNNRFQLRPQLTLPTPGSDEALYFLLLDEYLAYYFPTAPNVKPPTLAVGTQFKTSSNPYQGIKKSSLLLRHTSAKTAFTGSVSLREAWCCDILIDIFSTLWLDEAYFKSVVTATGTSGAGMVPTDNHVRAVRLLVKYVHYFCNAHMENTLARRLQSDSLIEQANQNVMNKLQPKLYGFLVHCFDVWPLNQTFRIVLETWLSYIQPWRYVRDQENRFSDARGECNVNNNWYHFVFTNLKFYSVLFQLAIKRFLRMDISTVGNSLLLFRVAKIYGLPNLITLIDQAEEATPLSYQPSRNYDSYIINQPASFASETKEENVFSPTSTNLVKQLLDMISQSLEMLQSSNTDANSDWSNRALGFLGYGALVENSSSQTGSDRKKAEQNLNYAMKIFAEMYELPTPIVGRKTTKSSCKGIDNIADHIVDENGKISLSPKGRYQLQNNMKRFPIIPKADPDLRPICSFESALLVRALYKLSSRFNAVYQDDIEVLCQKKDFMGKVCRILFLQKDEYPTVAYGSHPKPKLSLRFLAHYRSIFYLGVLYALARLFGYNFFFVLFYIFLLYVVWVFFKALLMKE